MARSALCSIASSADKFLRLNNVGSFVQSPRYLGSKLRARTYDLQSFRDGGPRFSLWGTLRCPRSNPSLPKSPDAFGRDRERRPHRCRQGAGREPQAARDAAVLRSAREYTVLELVPAGGWFTKILAPVLKDRGKLYVGLGPMDDVRALTQQHAELADVVVLDRRRHHVRPPREPAPSERHVLRRHGAEWSSRSATCTTIRPEMRVLCTKPYSKR